jgi:hypothetical protein
MTIDRIDALRALLSEAEEAHGVYETTELNGVYDQNWPRWYAQWAVEHGISDLIGRPVSVEELARFLTSSWQEAQGADPPPTDPWPVATARRIAAEL